MEQGNIWFILKILPYLAFVSIIGGFIGWYLRCKVGKCHGHHSEVVHSHDSDDLGRIKKLQEKLNKAESANQMLKLDLETSQAKSIDSSVHEKALEKLSLLQSDLSATTLRANSLEADLKKAKETVGSFHAKSNLETKEQRDRTFALENELSQARSEIARLGSGKDDSSELRAEMERLRESTSNATRYAGEMRKREAALTEELAASKIALQQAQDQLLFAPVPAKQTVAKPVVAAAPAGDSPRVIAAKEEVIRLQAQRIATAKAEAIRAAAEHAAEVKAAAEAKAAEAEVLATPVVEEVAAPQKIQEASDVLGKRVLQDDLKIIEGIGPKIEELIQAAGINTWSALSAATPEQLSSILQAAGDAYGVHNPATWPRQAAFASEGKWTELKEWQDQLDGGKEVS